MAGMAWLHAGLTKMGVVQNNDCHIVWFLCGNAGKRAEGSKKVIISYDDVEFMAKNMPQYKYIDGNKRNPVTFEYVMQAVQDGKISKGDAEIWIESADIPYPKQGN